ncbi:hypothetical protein M433DRAFT_144556 [Acidomyces richmondensis BFW]|nr:MAG: hypothetical protein FE78DRAFT_79273 [Acidomyces sp. 'richmondensis']KYG44787.1 hypothetical protein M433DRAFT_144556 [Acidomyces richmondensis BFW]
MSSVLFSIFGVNPGAKYTEHKPGTKQRLWEALDREMLREGHLPDGKPLCQLQMTPYRLKRSAGISSQPRPSVHVISCPPDLTLSSKSGRAIFDTRSPSLQPES